MIRRSPWSTLARLSRSSLHPPGCCGSCCPVTARRPAGARSAGSWVKNHPRRPRTTSLSGRHGGGSNCQPWARLPTASVCPGPPWSRPWPGFRPTATWSAAPGGQASSQTARPPRQDRRSHAEADSPSHGATVAAPSPVARSRQADRRPITTGDPRYGHVVPVPVVPPACTTGGGGPRRGSEQAGGAAGVVLAAMRRRGAAQDSAGLRCRVWVAVWPVACGRIG